MNPRAKTNVHEAFPPDEGRRTTSLEPGTVTGGIEEYIKPPNLRVGPSIILTHIFSKDCCFRTSPYCFATHTPTATALTALEKSSGMCMIEFFFPECCRANGLDHNRYWHWRWCPAMALMTQVCWYRRTCPGLVSRVQISPELESSFCTGACAFKWR